MLEYTNKYNNITYKAGKRYKWSIYEDKYEIGVLSDILTTEEGIIVGVFINKNGVNYCIDISNSECNIFQIL